MAHLRGRPARYEKVGMSGNTPFEIFLLTYIDIFSISLLLAFHCQLVTEMTVGLYYSVVLNLIEQGVDC
jgi:hypothetical protein